jgi:hypothetical protein
MGTAADPQLLAAEADALLSAPNAGEPEQITRGLAILAALEAATPGGAPLHHQIDVVRRWVEVLRNESGHARFGGTAHLRDHLAMQLRLLRAGVADYLAAGQSR